MVTMRAYDQFGKLRYTADHIRSNSDLAALWVALRKAGEFFRVVVHHQGSGVVLYLSSSTLNAPRVF